MAHSRGGLKALEKGPWKSRVAELRRGAYIIESSFLFLCPEFA